MVVLVMLFTYCSCFWCCWCSSSDNMKWWRWVWQMCRFATEDNNFIKMRWCFLSLCFGFYHHRYQYEHCYYYCWCSYLDNSLFYSKKRLTFNACQCSVVICELLQISCVAYKNGDMFVMYAFAIVASYNCIDRFENCSRARSFC